MARKITIFSIQVTDNNYIERPLQKLCISSWINLKKAIQQKGFEVEIKIYTPEDKEFIEFKNIYGEFNYFPEDKLNRVADAFRCYILSKYEEQIYLDTDVYIFPNTEFKYGPELDSTWCILSNLGGNNLVFKKLFDYYSKKENKDLLEKDTIVSAKVLQKMDYKRELYISKKLHCYLYDRVVKPMNFVYIDSIECIQKCFDYLEKDAIKYQNYTKNNFVIVTKNEEIRDCIQKNNLNWKSKRFNFHCIYGDENFKSFVLNRHNCIWKGEM